MILVSACLAGLNTKYDDTANSDDKVIALVKAGKAIPVCPEQLGGLPTPRPRAVRKGNKVIHLTRIRKPTQAHIKEYEKMKKEFAFTLNEGVEEDIIEIESPKKKVQSARQMATEISKREDLEIITEAKAMKFNKDENLMRF